MGSEAQSQVQFPPSCHTVRPHYKHSGVLVDKMASCLKKKANDIQKKTKKKEKKEYVKLYS